MTLLGTLSTRPGGRKRRAKIDHGRCNTKEAASARDVAEEKVRIDKIRKSQAMT